MPTMLWNAKWVMLTGGRSWTGKLDRPSTGLVKELRAISEPRYGMSIDHLTSPSMRRPPSRNGEGLSVSIASSNAASFAGCVSASRLPSRCPMSGWRTAETLANPKARVNPSRCARSRRPRSNPTAYTDAIVNPATM